MEVHTKYSRHWGSRKTWTRCLFDVLNDASEYFDVCDAHQTVCNDLHERLERANEKVVGIVHTSDSSCRRTSDALYGGYLGPILGAGNPYLTNENPLNLPPSFSFVASPPLPPMIPFDNSPAR
eukprot:4649302-Pleurochrysis_carterae.AAC.1